MLVGGADADVDGCFGAARLHSVHRTYYLNTCPDVNSIMSIRQNTIQWRHGVENDAGRCLRRMRASVDTRNGEPAELPVEEVPLDPMGQRWGRWQDAGGADQGGAQP